jgi:hypothetical protein
MFGSQDGPERALSLLRGLDPMLAGPPRGRSCVYATRHTGSNAFDLYGLVEQRGSQFYYRGVGPEVRDTLGVRYATSSKMFDSDTELDKQYGSINGAVISAYAIETNLGYDFGRNRNRFRLGVGGGIASGDHDPRVRPSRCSVRHTRPD